MKAFSQLLKPILRLVFCGIFAAILAPQNAAAKPAESFLVKRVIDGDTVHLQGAKGVLKVRFYGIDAPESSQPFGKFCTKLLREKIGKKHVNIELFGADQYKRLIAKIWLGEEDINRFMVARGCAWAYAKYSREYISEEAAAKRARLGLWADSKPLAPWKYRHAHQKPKKQPHR